MFYLQKNNKKATYVKNNCIIKIKIMNKIQCIKIFKVDDF